MLYPLFLWHTCVETDRDRKGLFKSWSVSASLYVVSILMFLAITPFAAVAMLLMLPWSGLFLASWLSKTTGKAGLVHIYNSTLTFFVLLIIFIVLFSYLYLTHYRYYESIYWWPLTPLCPHWPLAARVASCRDRRIPELNVRVPVPHPMTRVKTTNSPSRALVLQVVSTTLCIGCVHWWARLGGRPKGLDSDSTATLVYSSLKRQALFTTLSQSKTYGWHLGSFPIPTLARESGRFSHTWIQRHISGNFCRDGLHPNSFESRRLSTYISHSILPSALTKIDRMKYNEAVETVRI